MGKKIPPILAVAGGVVGFALRKWQLTAGFEAGTGLAIPGAPSALALVAWTAFIALAVSILGWNNKGRQSWEKAFSAGKGNAIYITAVVLGAFLLLASAGAEAAAWWANPGIALYEGQSRLAQMAAKALPPLRILLGLGALPCVILWSREVYTGGEKGKESLCLLELCLLFCVWLISDYQRRASDPVVMDYLYEVFVIVCSLLSLYYLAGYSFQTGKPRRTVFFCLMGAYFALVTLADSHSLADLLRCGFSVLFLTAHAALVLNQPPVEEAPAEAETEAQDHG